MGTVGIGLLCAPVTIAPLVLGMFEIIYATQLVAEPPKQKNLSQAIPILEICCILAFNVVSLVVGILSLVFASDPKVQGYFASLNE